MPMYVRIVGTGQDANSSHRGYISPCAASYMSHTPLGLKVYNKHDNVKREMMKIPT